MEDTGFCHKEEMSTCRFRMENPEEEDLIRMVDRIICGYIRQEGDDLSVRQLAVLVQIAQNPMEITPLANSLRLPLPTISRSIDTLEKLKLAKRSKKGKFVTAMATPLGQAKVGRLMANISRDHA